MPTCKVCGAPCDASDKYCPYCGSELETKVASNQQQLQNNYQSNTNSIASDNIDIYNVFKSNNWRDAWVNLNRNNGGIILTDTTKLSNPSLFLNTIKRYIDFKKKEGLSYTLLDLANEQVKGSTKAKVEDIVELLKKIYDVSVPSFLMIVGDWNVIPSMRFKNKTQDSDEFVPSDLPYITLNCDSPWSGIKFNFKNITKVGRVPGGVLTNLNEAIKYFNNVMAFNPYKKEEVKDFAISAESWKETNKKVCDELGIDMYLSPPNVCIKNKRLLINHLLPKLDGYRALNIFLHGSGNTHYLYGQLGDIYPEAFEAKLLPDGKYGGYLIMCGACYGAKPNVEKKNADSILLNAITNNCMGYVGSSVISYTGVNGWVLCSNVLLLKCFEEARLGKTLGECYLAGLDALTKNDLREYEIKVIAEYSLYADPSLSFYQGSDKKAFGVMTKKCEAVKSDKFVFDYMEISEDLGFFGENVSKAFPKGIDPYANMEAKTKAKMIRKITEDFKVNHLNKEEIHENKFFKIVGSDEYRSVIKTKSNDNITKYVNLVISDSGEIIQAIESC